MNSISSEFLLWRMKGLVCCERSQSVPQCWAHHWMGKGKERKGHQQAIAWSIYSGCQMSADISKELQSMPSASKSTAEGENPLDRPQATWPEVGPFDSMSNSELLAHPGSLVRVHEPSFPSLSPDALTVVTKGHGCWHPLPGYRLSMQAAAMGGKEQPRLMSSWVTCRDSHTLRWPRLLLRLDYTDLMHQMCQALHKESNNLNSTRSWGNTERLKHRSSSKCNPTGSPITKEVKTQKQPWRNIDGNRNHIAGGTGMQLKRRIFHDVFSDIFKIQVDL